MHEGEVGLEVVASGFFLGGMLDEELDDDLDADEDETCSCAPYLARWMSCLQARTPRVKDTPFLGSARGAKEAEDLLTRSEFVGGERAGKQEKHTAIYPGSGRPKANSPTPACLDRCHHDGELQVVFLGEVPGRVAARGRRRADPALGRSPLSPTSSPRLKLSAWSALPAFLLVSCLRAELVGN